MNQKKATLLIAILLILLISSNWYHIVDKSNREESIGKETRAFRDSVDKVNYKLVIENDSVLQDNKELKDTAKILKEKLPEAKRVWNDGFVQAKIYRDTNAINQLNKIHLETIAVYDSLIANCEKQIVNLELVHKNDTSIISNQKDVMDLQSDVILDQECELKKEKRKKVFYKIAAGAAIIVSLIIAL